MPEIIDTERHAWVTTSLPDGHLVLEEMSGYESLGAPFTFELFLVSSAADVSLADLLGLSMTVHLILPEGERQFNGIVTHAEHRAAEDNYARYRITLRPRLSLLSYTSNCRIFQDKSVVDIIKEIFRDNGFSDFDDALSDTYPAVEYCAQYRESDFNFVSRLMEQEGIYYYFKHEDGKHTLVLADEQSAHATTPGYEEVPYKPPHDTIESDHIDSWVVAQQIRPGGFAATDYDFTRPRASLLSQLKTPLDNAAADYALFEYPGQFLTTDAGNARVKMRLQEAQVSYEIVEAAGDARGLGTGMLFTLTEFPRDDQNKKYLIVSAHYRIHAGTYDSGGSGAEKEFQGGYTLIDSHTPFRPSLHAAKPRVEGPQTAVVVGKAGEEIWTDKYGRVKVQFHWDREGKDDEKSSCWVRVSQAWAGPGWGGIHIPRIGQEVIVDFLEGDPDRPIITGRVYNADNMPPYTLPDNQTQSGIKSRSTQGGSPSNFNEIRFEDKKGSEELFIQAEKDQNTKVKQSQSISVGGSRSISVGGNESTSVTGTRSATITKKETQTFKDAREMSVALTDTETITGKQTGTYHGGRELTVDKFDDTTVNSANKNTVVHGQFNVTADEHYKVQQGGNQVFVKDQVYVESTGEIQLKNGKGHLDMKDGVFKVTSAEEITLECGSAKISLKKDGTIEIHGLKTAVIGSTEVDITGSAVKING